jgi:hypothetical protein
VEFEGEDEDEAASAMVSAAPVPRLPPVRTRRKRAPSELNPPAVPASAPDAETLQTLLASIKQELKNAAKI